MVLRVVGAVTGDAVLLAMRFLGESWAKFAGWVVRVKPTAVVYTDLQIVRKHNGGVAF
jgi:hypothetical protein